MKHTIEELHNMRKAMLGLQQAPPTTNIPTYVESIILKLRFLNNNCLILQNIDWTRASYIGIQGVDFQIICGDGTDIAISIKSHKALELIIMNALDGLVSSSINAIDTLARILNSSYSLGIPDWKANMPLVARKIKHGCAISSVIQTQPGIIWMNALRQLRGECQHANLASILIMAQTTIGAPMNEPLIPNSYCTFSNNQGNQRISVFSEYVRNKSFELLKNIAAIISSNPASAVVKA